MLFFEEPQNTFSVLSVLQMGRNYGDNRDGYVYVYACDGNTEGTMNQLVLCRVPKAHILERAAYEFFSTMKSDGSATWTKDINARAVVQAFPSGWVNSTGCTSRMAAERLVQCTASCIHDGQLGATGSGSDGAGSSSPVISGSGQRRIRGDRGRQIHERLRGRPATIPGRAPTCR
jgi:hypothetical protein